MYYNSLAIVTNYAHKNEQWGDEIVCICHAPCHHTSLWILILSQREQVTWK